MTAFRKRWAVAPSIRRWSKESDSGSIGRTTTWPSRATGFSCTRPSPRIATSGGLMMGVPKEPKLVMVKLLPLSSLSAAV